MSFRDEVPQRSFINAEILQSVVKTEEWKKSLSAVEKKYGLDHYEFMNSAYVVSLLYCLLVVPKEIWAERPEYRRVLDNIDSGELRPRIRLHLTPPKFEDEFVFNFIYRLRNSIAHANYEIDGNMDFQFWDRYENEGEINFQCSISRENIMWILSKIGTELANLRVAVG